METLLTSFKKYAVFSGRADRKEYWVFFLFCVITGTIITNTVDLFLSNMVGTKLGIGNLIFTLATIIPWVAVRNTQTT